MEKKEKSLSKEGQQKLVDIIEKSPAPTKEMVDLMEGVSLPKLGEDAADCVVK